MGNIPKPLVLMILDGWGISDKVKGNAVKAANTPTMDGLHSAFPSSQLEAFGEAVGLLPDQMGNSNVGHFNLGAGRIVYQDIVRINKSIDSGAFFDNPVLLSAMKGGKRLHIMGLVSDGGVHSHICHLEALLSMAKRNHLEEVYIHAFLDGRDVGPSTASKYLKRLERTLRQMKLGRIATVSGRYYAMDRDKRWARTRKAYDALVLGHGETAPGSLEAVRLAYSRGETDEFVTPTVIVEEGRPVGKMGPEDSVFFFNFRADRARQITRALTEENFHEFPRPIVPLSFAGMTQYFEVSPLPAAFKPQSLKNTLGEVISREGLRQLRIAETEKYAHVTFFFNGGSEAPFPGESRILVPSPKVSTYDKVPEMSAYEVTRRLLAVSSDYDLVILNYANPDMVGHTGDMEAATKAVEVVDDCVGRVVHGVLEHGGAVVIVSDHGNAEQMLEGDGEDAHTAHTGNRVPFILVDPERRTMRVRDGILADVAPTLLEILGLLKPEEMEGHSLLECCQD